MKHYIKPMLFVVGSILAITVIFQNCGVGFQSIGKGGDGSLVGSHPLFSLDNSSLLSMPLCEANCAIATASLEAGGRNLVMVEYTNNTNTDAAILEADLRDISAAGVDGILVALPLAPLKDVYAEALLSTIARLNLPLKVVLGSDFETLKAFYNKYRSYTLMYNGLRLAFAYDGSQVRLNVGGEDGCRIFNPRVGPPPGCNLTGFGTVQTISILRGEPQDAYVMQAIRGPLTTVRPAVAVLRDWASLKAGQAQLRMEISIYRYLLQNIITAPPLPGANIKARVLSTTPVQIKGWVCAPGFSGALQVSIEGRTEMVRSNEDSTIETQIECGTDHAMTGGKHNFTLNLTNPREARLVKLRLIAAAPEGLGYSDRQFEVFMPDLEGAPQPPATSPPVNPNVPTPMISTTCSWRRSNYEFPYQRTIVDQTRYFSCNISPEEHGRLNIPTGYKTLVRRVDGDSVTSPVNAENGYPDFNSGGWTDYHYYGGRNWVCSAMWSDFYEDGYEYPYFRSTENTTTYLSCTNDIPDDWFSWPDDIYYFGDWASTEYFANELGAYRERITFSPIDLYGRDGNVPLNCVVTDWSETNWPPKNMACGTTHTRTRDIIREGTEGGTPCPVLSETAYGPACAPSVVNFIAGANCGNMTAQKGTPPAQNVLPGTPVAVGEQVTIGVTPPAGYEPVAWSANGVSLIAGQGYATCPQDTRIANGEGAFCTSVRFIVPNVPVSVNVTCAKKKYLLTLSAPTCTGATLSGGAIYEAGQTATFAIADIPANKSFSGWSSGTAMSSVSNTIVMNENKTVIATCADKPLPPVITKQPTALSVKVGDSVLFKVEASGAQPLTFQWRVNGVNVAGVASTASTLTFENVQANRAGKYTVVVSNSVGSVTSEEVELKVMAEPPPPMLTFSASPSCGTLNVNSFTTGVPQPITSGTSVPAGKAVTFDLALAVGVDVGSWTGANFTSRVGYATCSTAGQNIASGQGTFCTAVTMTMPAQATNVFVSCQPKRYELVLNSTTCGPTPGFNGAGIYEHGTTAAYRINLMTIAPKEFVRWSTGGTSPAGSAVMTSNQTVTAICTDLAVPRAPMLTAQPQSIERTIGEAAFFTVSIEAPSGGMPTFQWRKDNVNIPGATNMSYQIGSVVKGHAGEYRVAVTNSAGTILSNPATLKVNDPGDAGEGEEPVTTSKLTYSSSPNVCGSLSGTVGSGGLVKAGDTVKLSFLNLASGYDVANWSSAGINFTSKMGYATCAADTTFNSSGGSFCTEVQFTMPATPVNVAVMCAPKRYLLSVDGPTCTGAVFSGSAIYEHGTRATFGMTLPEDKVFMGWNIGSSPSQPSGNSIVMVANMTATANCKAKDAPPPPPQPITFSCSHRKDAPEYTAEVNPSPTVVNLRISCDISESDHAELAPPAGTRVARFETSGSTYGWTDQHSYNGRAWKCSAYPNQYLHPYFMNTETRFYRDSCSLTTADREAKKAAGSTEREVSRMSANVRDASQVAGEYRVTYELKPPGP